MVSMSDLIGRIEESLPASSEVDRRYDNFVKESPPCIHAQFYMQPQIYLVYRQATKLQKRG